MLNFLFRLIAALPLRVVHAIGAMAGRLVYLVSPTFRRRTRDNLAQAGYGSAGLAAAVAGEAGKQALETAWVWLRPHAEVVGRVVVEPAEAALFERVLADSRPVVFLTPHFGCFEVAARWVAVLHSARHARPITVLYRVPRKEALRRIVAEGRALEHLIPAPADLGGVRQLMRAMQRRELVGILPDQVPTNGDGVWAPFFGRLAYTMTLPARLARQYDGIIVYAFGERLAAGRGWRLRLRRLEHALSGDPLADATLLNQGMEALIRTCPVQYLWSYNRYKVPAGVVPPTAAAA
ncbi:MAG: lysophospholipid acyltransferase family protein [Burkholderiaceae bacterium]|nr:lysophospholipid acyltransferase family protein [Burkholderiaceae bacterium]